MRSTILIFLLLPLLSFSQFGGGTGFFFNNHADEGFGDLLVEITTTSNLASFSTSGVTATGTLHWEVTGAVSYSVDQNDPTFDFSSNTSNSDIFIKIYSSLGASALTRLLYGVENNRITNFDISAATGLIITGVENGLLTSLDLSGLSLLKTIDFSSNSISSLTLPSNDNLGAVDLALNLLSGSVDLSNRDSLSFLAVWGNTGITSLNVTGCSNLASINLSNCNLTSLDLTGISSISFLNASLNSLLSSITNLSSQTSLTTLYLNDCNFTNLDLTALTSMGLLRVEENNSLSSLTLPATNTNLNTIYARGITDNYITPRVSNFTNIIYIDYSDNNNQSASVILEYLEDLDANGKSNGYADFRNTSDPTSLADDEISSLQAKGWTVLTDRP